MKTFKFSAAQGEITIRRVGDVPSNKALPNGYSTMHPEKGLIIVGHSETGHNHVMEASHVSAAVLDRVPEGLRVLRLIVENATPLTHQREFDQHEPIMFDPGEYEIRISREYDPYAELARRVAD